MPENVIFSNSKKKFFTIGPNYMLTIVLDNNDKNNLETNYHNNTTAIDKLICIDPLRSNYYKDLSM